MKIQEAISIRITNIIYEKNLSVNKLANISLLTQSTLESIISGKSKNPKLLTIVRICDGLNISLKDFFDDKLFQNIERED